MHRIRLCSRGPGLKPTTLILMVLVVLFVRQIWSTPRPRLTVTNENLLQEVDPGQRQYAFTALLTTDRPAHFHAARVLAYQLLHDPLSRTRTGIPFVVMVTSAVPGSYRKLLEELGCLVHHVADVPLPWWLSSRAKKFPRYRDQFIKFRALQMLQYDRILYLDVDHVITGPLDSVFNTTEVREQSHTNRGKRPGGDVDWRRILGYDEPAKMPDAYVFAARPDLGHNDDNKVDGDLYKHPLPPVEHDYFNAGFWVAKPSNEIYNFYLSVLETTRINIGGIRTFDPQYMEQAMLNYVHRADGRMPWSHLDWHWSTTYPAKQDLAAGVVALHDKFWEPNRLQQASDRWQQMKIAADKMLVDLHQ